MAPPIQCPSCSQRYPFNEALSGKRVKCKKCGGAFVVPAPPAAAPAAGFSDFLAEELDTPHPAAAPPPAVAKEPPSPYHSTFDEPEGKPSKKKKKPKREKQKTSILSMIGFMLIVMPYAQAAARHEPLIQGPFTAAFVVGTTCIGLVLIALGWLRR
ncbi:MAG: hypothetical protein JW818_16290 [Pirellulales bacterium]|nr:hypothetical protein [Pirellulales bacterium]